MKKQLVFVQNWFEKRSSRDRIYLFISGLLFFYLIYILFFKHTLTAERNALTQKIHALQEQQITIDQQISAIDALVKNPVLVQMLQQQKQLQLRLERMQQQIDSLKPRFFSNKDMPLFTKMILKQESHDTILIRLQEFPEQGWPTQATTEKPTAEKTEQNKMNLLNVGSGIFQHILQIEFQNDYVNTIEYLKGLEKISNRMYWDSMEYKVLKYPKANVIIKFHVLSLQKD